MVQTEPQLKSSLCSLNNSIDSTVDAVKRFLLAEINAPEMEKSISTFPDDAGMLRSLWASFSNFG